MLRKFLAAAIAAVAIVHGLSSMVSHAADVSITAANVKLSGELGEVKYKPYLCGEALAAGDLAYQHTDQKLYKADNDDTAAKAKVVGIVVMGNSLGGVALVAYEGPVLLGTATVAAGMNYCLSSTAGKLCPVADLNSGDRIVSLGNATSTSVVWFSIKNYNAQVP